jgi:hypothetical protein
MLFDLTFSIIYLHMKFSSVSNSNPLLAKGSLVGGWTANETAVFELGVLCPSN